MQTGGCRRRAGGANARLHPQGGFDGNVDAMQAHPRTAPRGVAVCHYDERDRPDFELEADFVDLRAPLPLDLLDLPDLLEDDLLERPLEDLPDDDFRDEPLEDLPELERLLVDDLLEEDFLEPPEDFLDDLPDGDLLEEDLLDDPDFADFLLPLEPFFPLPDFLPPPDCLFTVAQARRSASFFDTPRSS